MSFALYLKSSKKYHRSQCCAILDRDLVKFASRSFCPTIKYHHLKQFTLNKTMSILPFIQITL